MRLVKLSELSEEERQKVLAEQKTRTNRNKQASKQIRVEVNNKFNDYVSKNGSYDTAKHTTTIGNLKKAYKNTSNYNNIKKSLDNYYKNNTSSLWDKVKQIATTSAGRTNNYNDSINEIRNISNNEQSIENRAKQEYDNLKNLGNIQSNAKSYQKKQEDALKSTLAYKQAKLQNPNATEEELLKSAKNSSSELQTNLIKDMASKNGAERTNELKKISNSDGNPLFYDNNKYRELNNEVLQYKTATEAQEQANKINEDLKNGKVGSSVGHVLQALPTKAMEAVASPIYATGSLLNLKTPTGTADQDLKDWKTISSKYDQTTSNINNGLVRDASNVSGTIGYMIPSILTSAIAPETNLGRIAQGVSVGGQSYIENLNDDASNKLKSALTGVGKGTASYAIEGISGGNILGKGSLDDLAVKTIASKTSNVASKKLASMVYEVGGEVFEEELENQVGYLIDKIVNDEGISLNEWLTEQKETVKSTIASTLVLKLLGLGGSTYKDVQEYEYNAEAKKWINEAEKIIKKENLGIDVDKLKAKNNQTEVNKVLNTLENENNTSNLQPKSIQSEQNITNQQITSIENKMANNGKVEQNIENNLQKSYNDLKIGENTKVPIETILNIQDSLGGYRTQEQINNLKNDIITNGITTPIEIYRKNDGTFAIENGNHRIKIAQELGIKDIPVKLVESWESIGLPKENVSKIDSNKLEGKYNERDSREISRTNENSWNRKGSMYNDNVQSQNSRTTEKNVELYEATSNSNEFTGSKGNKENNRSQGLEKSSSFNLPTKQDIQKNILPIKEKQVQTNNKITNNGNVGQNNVLPIQNYVYEKSNNVKIDNLRQDASKHWDNSSKTRNYVNMLEKIIQDKNIEIRLDTNLKTSDGKVANGSYSDGVITINPNSSRTGEFIAVHELTHAIGTDSMRNIIETYRKSNAEFNTALDALLQNYNSTELTNEALADVSAQLFGNQEFINSVSQNNPNIFKKIYNEIKYLWHQFKGYKNQDQFIEDLYYKWTQAYNSSNKLNTNSSFSIQTNTDGSKYVQVDTDQDIFDGIAKKDYNKIAKMYIQDYLLGKTQLSNSDIAIIDKKSANKYTNPGKKQQNFDKKMLLTPELKNVLEISQIDNTSLPTKDTSKYGKWEYYKFKFELSGKKFEGTVNIGIDSDGNKHFYEINKIKEIDDISGKNLNRSSTSSIDNSIAPSNKDVNTTTKYSIQESKNNSGSFNLPTKEWQSYLEQNYKSTGTKTNLEDIKLPTKQDTQKNILPIKEETQINMPTTQGETINWNEIERPEGKIRKHYRSIIESSNTTKQAKTIAKELMGTDTYVPETNKGQLLQADNRINSSTPEVELKSLMSKAVNGEKIEPVDIAVGERLIQYYSKIGDKTNLQEAIQATAMAGTSAGQTVQALAMLNHQTPQGQATWIQRTVDKMNNELAKKKGGIITKDSDGNIKVVNKQGKDITNKVELFDLTSDMLEKVVNSNNETEMYNNIDQVYEELGQQVSKSTIEKLDSWRYFSMLANARTHIRNMVGNVAMGKMQRVKDKLAGGIEDVVSIFNKDMERTKSLKLADKKTKEFAKNDFNNAEVQSRLELNENKYNPQSRLQNARRTFKLDIFEKTLGSLFNLNDNLLSAEDGLGLKSAYQKALSDYITANKIDVDKITDTQLGKARNYAVQQAKEATFHQANAIATWINQANKYRGLKEFKDAILPFVKTPLNVAKAGLEYNPTGLLKTITVDTVKLNKGDISVNKYIDNLSKGLTGTGIAILGYALADAGLLKASSQEDDDKKENYDEARGKQQYSLQIAGKTYSLDWLAPAGIPLFTGAEAYVIQNARKKEKSSISSDDDLMSNQIIRSLENWSNAMIKSISPMSELSMISGLTSALSSYNDDKFSSIITNAVKSYINQYVPTLLGQVAKTTDDYERSTTSTKTGPLTKAIDQTKLQIMSKVPGLRQQLPVKSDIWGNEQKQSENLPVRIFNNFINPATVKNVETSAVDEELNELYDKTGESSILPTAINKTYTIDGQTYRMTNEEYANYKKSYGQTAYKLIEGLTNSKDYNSLSNVQKQKVIENIYSYAKEANKIDYAKNNNIEVEQSTLYTTLQDLKKNGASQSSYLTYLGKTADVEKSVQKNQILRDSNYTDETKSIIYKNKNTTEKDDNLYNILSNGNIDINEYLEYKIKDSNEEFSADKDSNGDSISGSSKKKICNYVKYNISGEGNRLIILGSKYKLEDDERRTLANYIDETVTNNSDKLKAFESLSKNFVVKNGKVYYK